MNVNVKDKINNPVEQVYQSIINKEKLSCYFISRASKNVKEGEQIVWFFDDFGVELTVDILNVIPYKSISFKWSASGQETQVNISLRSEDQMTQIEIVETEFSLNENGWQRAMQQTQGWTDFICSLKAYLYTNINLRNGHMNT